MEETPEKAEEFPLSAMLTARQLKEYGSATVRPLVELGENYGIKAPSMLSGVLQLLSRKLIRFKPNTDKKIELELTEAGLLLELPEATLPSEGQLPMQRSS